MRRNSLFFKIISIKVLFTFVFQIVFPTLSYGLTSGPSQPETQSFTPANVSEMVDPFSGNFSYNIPLMDVGGYPIGLSYNAGATMDQEASWVGLGWNINPGVINRNVRGLPDDFKGDKVEKTFNMKRNETYGANGFGDLEFFGVNLEKLGIGLKVGVGLKYNNYSGIGFDYQVHPSIGGALGSKSSYTANLGISFGSSGVGVSPSVSYNRKVNENDDMLTNMSSRLGSSFNSRTGLQSASLTNSLSNTDATTVRNDEGKVVSKTIHSETNRSKSMSSGHISFASPSQTPTIQNSFINNSLSLSFSLGSELYGGNPNFEISGYYSAQKVREPEVSNPAFGYLYHQEGVESTNHIFGGLGTSNALLDFNREKDVGYSKEVKNLPVTAATYDIFSVSGEGIGGSYRLFRNDVGSVFDNTNANNTSGLSIGGPEFGVGGIAKGGVNVAVNSANTTTSKWKTGNSTYSLLQYHKQRPSSEAEPVYFRKSGEKNVMANKSFFDKFGGFDAISFDLEDKTELLSAKRSFTKSRGGSGNLIANDNQQNLNPERQARNEAILYYTAEEAEKYGVFDHIRTYPEQIFHLSSDGTYTSNQPDDRYDSDQMSPSSRKKHHISEISVFSADGRRYVYSDPIYNFVKEEVTFATNNGRDSEGLVGYTPNDDTKNNDNGLDNYYNKVVTPAYPTAFLLSAIVSSDYVDRDGIKGPSDEDLGNYTKFNYTKATGNFKWRTPFKKDKASFNDGFKTKGGSKGDNKANYVYGIKEVKYLHSIETKTHVAEFELEDRNDGFGVKGRRGGIEDEVALKKLKKIRLYAKEDKIKEINDPNYEAVPIKTVHFDYYENDSSLCKEIDNGTANGGKLSLKRVYFTYGKSNRGKLSPYEFEYGGGGSLNPTYNTKAIDRWGNYQPNQVVDHPGNEEYPYTDQSNDASGNWEADANAAAWNLSKITLPSGGVINVEYEADDYAFVQDRKAMQMFKVLGFSDTKNGTFNNSLYGGGNRLFMKIELTQGVSDWRDLFIDKGRLIDKVYFKMLVNVEELNELHKKEYITGYASLDIDTEEGAEGEPIIDGNTVTFKVEDVEGSHPVSYATFNLMKKHFPRIVYEQAPMESTAVRQIFNSLVDGFKAIGQFVSGIDNKLKSRGIGKFVDLDRSWVRLYNPNGNKKGGGHRVKKIAISDQWNEMTDNSNPGAVYGQHYDYTMENDYGKTISSGVAAYEPILGNEENPWRQPRTYEKKNLLVPDEQFYVEEPMGEMYFPGASVGYRKVTVRNIDSNGDFVSTGKVVNEFYTAYDFPTITDEVPIKIGRKRPNFILKLLNLSGKDYVSTSQGYVVELNDMHGKEKAKWVYQHNDEAPYSGTEYKYKQLSPSRIASQDLVIDKSGQISKKYLGLEVDMVTDIRQSKSSSSSTSMDFNLDGFMVFIVPVAIPMIWPTHSREVTRYNSIVFNKVIKRHGLLKETIHYSQKSQVGITKNLIRDAESGEVLLTESVNEYGDSRFAFNYPAYWAYDQMGPIYKSLDMSIKMSNDDVINEYLKVGDKVSLVNGGNVRTAWVSLVNGSASNFINVDGEKVSSSISDTVRIIDPARTNQQMQKVGSVITKRNPARDLDGNGEPDQLVFDEVLQASTTEFTEQAKVFCNCTNWEEGTPFNPFTTGTRGIWKPWREFSYVTDRMQSRRNDNVDKRRDGNFVEFSPFWTVNPKPGNDWQPNYAQWIYTAEATTFNPYGKELESRDALGRYSAAIFGYNHALPTAVAKNARYKHIAFDGFEDYGTEDCADDHFSYEQTDSPSDVTDEEAHTGEKSIKVGPSVGGDGGSKMLRKVIVECD